VVLQALGNCGSNCRTRECPTPSPPSLSLSHFSFALHNLQQSYQHSLGNWDNSLHSWKIKVGWILLVTLSWEWMDSWSSIFEHFFWGWGVNFVFFVVQKFHELFWCTLLLAQSTYTRVVASTGSCGQGKKKEDGGCCFVIPFPKMSFHFVNEL
jgi:hypothetical protein